MATAIKEAIQNFVNPKTSAELKTTNKALYSQTEKMLAAKYKSSKKVVAEESAKPLITEPNDAIVRITTTTICGSDLHMYHDAIPGIATMMKGDILGHEGVGIVESVGPNVKNVKPGDRVVISAMISCGECEYCKAGLFSSCDTTNPSSQLEKLYGHRLTGVFGYSHLTGAYDGLQAEFARVPFADVNLLPVAQSVNISDDTLVLLSDIACTGWHGNELGEVREGQNVGIWGAGPVGLMAAMWAKFRGAARVLVIDHDEFRLAVAREKYGCETLNFDKVQSVAAAIMEKFPNGFDVGIDCVGYRYPSSLAHKIQCTLKLETDSPDVFNQMTYTIRKNGNMVLIGDYFGSANGVDIGRLMEKALTLRGGQVYVQKYWKKLLGYIMEGKVEPQHVITHHMPFDKVGEAYKIFDEHEDNAIKIILTTLASSTTR